jgi:hypothetical protein
MRRSLAVACMLVVSMVLCACNGLNAISQQNYSGIPTTYATTNKEPNPLLLNCFMRSAPSEYNRPNKYEFCLVKQGDKYAMYYYVMDGKSLATFKGWTDATINGDSVTAGYDGSTYFVKDGHVWQTTTTGGPHRMLQTN